MPRGVEHRPVAREEVRVQDERAVAEYGGSDASGPSHAVARRDHPRTRTAPKWPAPIPYRRNAA